MFSFVFDVYFACVFYLFYVFDLFVRFFYFIIIIIIFFFFLLTFLISSLFLLLELFALLF